MSVLDELLSFVERKANNRSALVSKIFGNLKVCWR